MIQEIDRAKKLNYEDWTLSTKAEQLKWRRSKVIEMRARGLSQVEIAHELQVSKASISSDMQSSSSLIFTILLIYITRRLRQKDLSNYSGICDGISA